MMLYNKNLITLKCVLFLFYGAVGGLFPFFLYHMDQLGFSRDDSTIISIISPLIATIGPLIVGPLADRLAGGFSGSARSKNGSYLRYLTAICMIFAVLFYGCLVLIEPIVKSPPNVTFMCDNSGGFILQDECNDPTPCYDFNGKIGSVEVQNCIFTCNRTTLYQPEDVTPSPEGYSGQENSTEEYPFDLTDADNEPETFQGRTRRFIDYGFEQLPHMCYKNLTDGNKTCAVYSEDTDKLQFDLGLKSTYWDHTDDSSPLTTNLSDYERDKCRYPFATDFHCRITARTLEDLRRDNPECEPVVLCQIYKPYDNPTLGSRNLLTKSECGYGSGSSFGLYFTLRSIGDLFTAAVVALLSTCVVIATRETSMGRGDVGKQFAAGALGFGLFPLIVGCLASGGFTEAIITFAVLIAFAVLILLIDFNMPLGPPEWWWHTRCGLLALPMSSVRKYGIEIVSLGVVLLTLGVFWSAIDVFLPWRIGKISDDAPGIIGATLAVASLPAAFYLIFAERFVDYCCHANILLICFVTYIIHHVGLLCTDDGGLLLLFETMEIFSLHIMYVTAVMYLRHLVPKKFTACGQALPVIAHFCIGRCIGAWLGSYAYTEDANTFVTVHQVFAIAAAIIAVIYFLAYHLCLKPKYVATPQLPPYPAPSVVQSMNGNGSYTPLRVYHTERSKKGHFRY